MLFRSFSSDTSGAPPKTFLSIARFGITNADVFVVDSAWLDSHRDYDTSKGIHFRNLHLSNLNLLLSGKIDKTTYEATIQNFFCEIDSPHFALKSFSGKFFASPSQIRTDGVDLQTEFSKISLSSRIDGVNIFSPFSFDTISHKHLDFSFYSPVVSLDELVLFFPSLSPLSGSAFLELNTAGEIGNLAISTLHAEAFESSVNLSGMLRALPNKDSLFLDANISDAAFSFAEVSSGIPQLYLPSLPGLGQIHFSGKLAASPHSCNADLLTTSNAGQIKTNTLLDWSNPELQYQSNFSAHSFSLQSVLQKESDNEVFPQTSLNIHGHVSGKGTSLGNIVSTASISIDSSSVLWSKIGRAHV